ncbi:apolipoprotein N-acyltransferase [candidate division KSB3 bacterium]|uniref:Apolipoprotein N-acyltransferase n=1 Tax=candidate division KSB3 bacterium TaxID=2044937 RepID=A0A9D5JZ84_9BACT|nr:apolipoprotein N-acyltransferase [candidate division KSB3 bacterium]MBD3327069.1 apolipoprotein N-acyltransferase [candidate division KSB3 bacterium]
MKVPNLRAGWSPKLGLAVLSGGLLILIFPKFNLEFLAWVAFIPLFAAIQGEDRRSTFWLGWIAGVIHFLGTLYWVTVTMVRYGGLSEVFSFLVLVLMAVYLALYMAGFGLLLNAFQRYTVFPLILTAPILWVGLEYLRSFFFLGFPWNLLGYSQFLTPVVTQIADITGVYGVSFLIMLVNAGLYTVFFTPTARPLKIKTLILTVGCVGITVGYGGLTLSQGTYTDESASDASIQAVRVAVVQGNIDQSIKWNREHRQQIMDKYARLSKETLDATPDLIVWPETAIPCVLQYDLPCQKHLFALVQELGTFLLLGGIALVPLPEPDRYYSLNSAFFLSPQGAILSKYDKIHLVPFGEYVPFERILFFVESITTAIGKVRPGRLYQVMSSPQIPPFSTVICFEVIFPNLVRKFVDRGARVLLNITNDAWFGKTAASYQHFAMVTFRAIENRVAVARAANTGISGFIDPYGRIIRQSEIFVDATMTHTLPIRQTTTFYTQYGDLFVRLCFGLSLLGIGSMVLTYRTHRKTRP